MGLDAVVYRRLDEIPLPRDTNLDFVRIEEVTGEVYLEGDRQGLTTQDVRAIHKRLGNIALIAALHDRIGRLLGPNAHHSLLLRKVLYNGTHGGDVIPVKDLGALRSEISFARERSRLQESPELNKFLADMEELVAASQKAWQPDCVHLSERLPDF
jgi:hypothetical protein